MSLREMLSDYWYAFQQELFPRLESELGPMGERYELFVAVLELVRVEALLPYFRGQAGRPEEDRAALARAFIAKAVFDVPTTRGLIERLEVDGRLWRLCGWSGAGRLPSEATFSRAFSEFAESGLASRLHETLIARTMDGHLVEHISRDATAIEAREKPAPKPKAAKPKRRRKRGRPRKGEARAKEPSRLERQLTMSLPQMLADLPRACDVGAKRNAIGEPGLRIDVVELRGADERVHDSGPHAPAVGAGEEPRFASETDAAQRPLGGVVGEADAAVVEEAREAAPALEHVIHRLGDGGMAR